MRKRWMALALGVVMLASTVFTGCGNKEQAAAGTENAAGGETAGTTEADNTAGGDDGGEAAGEETAGAPDISEQVDLVMYVIGSEDSSYQRIADKLNEKLLADLNCTLTIKYIGFGEYNTKYGLVLSSGEQVDLIYAARWLGWSNYVADGAYMDIAGIIENCMPQTCAEIDLEALKKIYDGSIYYLPSNFNTHQVYGYIVEKELREQLGYTEPIDNFDDYLELQKQALAMGYQDDLSQSIHEYDLYHLLMENYVEVTNKYYMKADDPEHKVYFVSEIPEIQDWFKSVEGWCNDGAWSKSVLSNTDTNRLSEGIAACAVRNKDTWLAACTANPDKEYEFAAIDADMYMSPFNYEGMAVGSSSKYPERALMVLEKFRQDASYYNLLVYGEAGVDYELNAEAGTYKPINADNFTTDNGMWGIRDDKFYLNVDGTPAAAEEVKEKAITREKINPLWLFVVDTDPIKSELAAVDNVYAQYYVPVSLGYVPYESGMEEVAGALETAGSTAIKEELQRQLDAYFAEQE